MTTQSEIPADALLVKETEPFTALTFTTRATLRTMQQHSHVPERLYAEAERLGTTPGGPIQYVYTGASGDETNEFLLEIALPVSGFLGQPDGFTLKTFEPFRCVSYTFAGPWNEFMTMYDALFAAFYQQGYQTDQRVREVYTVVDMENPTNCVTDIQIGLV